jgi:hypothetical protein
VPRLTGAWTKADGAVLTVRIGVSRAERKRLRLANRPIPQPRSIPALIDTGAEVTCIDPSAVTGLGLALRNFTFANLPAGGGLTGAGEYGAAILIPHPSGDPRDDFIVTDHAVTELPIGALGYEMLIGRDLLVLCAFRLDGPGLTFTFDY